MIFFSPWHFISSSFYCLQPLADSEGKRGRGEERWGRVRKGEGGGLETEAGLGGVRDGCKCGIM